jgi:hypothetical protein
MQPQLAIGLGTNRRMTGRLRGQPGVTYQLEYRDQFVRDGSWIPLTNLTLSGASATWQDSASLGTRYYRAVSLP